MGMDAAGGVGQDNTAHLKGKLGNLNETVRQLTENLNVHKKEVQIVLNKLVEISSGKWSSVAPVPKAKKNIRNHSTTVKGPTSLNMGIRKRETERIEKENHAFAKRLFDK